MPGAKQFVTFKRNYDVWDCLKPEILPGVISQRRIMSDDDKSYTSVLLPAARVTLFTRDAETKAALAALQQDWRFARVALEVIEGDAQTAAELYAQQPSPDLVIVQTEDINESFTQKIEALGGVCVEGTAAIIVGPVNDVNLYRRLVGMGISDYLVKPLKTGPLGNDIAATLLKRIGATGSRLIAFVGAKGGVGTTVLCEGTAWALSDKLGQKTFLLDASAGWSTLSVGMEFEPSTTLAEATRAAAEKSHDSLSRMVVNRTDKLSILSSGGDVMLDDSVSPEYYEALLDYFMATYPVVIADLSQSSPLLQRAVLARAHKIMVVTSPTLTSVRATRTLLKEIKDLRGGTAATTGDVMDIILNMQGLAAKDEVPKGQIEEGLERKLAAILPFNPDLFVRTESQARKLHEDKDGADLADKLTAIIRKVLNIHGGDASAVNDEDKKTSGIGSVLSKLKKKA